MNDEVSIEVARLENLLTVAEYKYARDISKLQQALLRTRRLGNIHIVGLHLKLIPLYEAAETLPMEYAFYHWKSQCNTDSAYKYKKFGSLLKYFYGKIMIKNFIVFREQAYRSVFLKMAEGNEYAHGSVPPLMSPADDEIDF